MWLENRSVWRAGVGGRERWQGPGRGHGDGPGSPEGKRRKGEGRILAGAPQQSPRDKGVALLALPLICDLPPPQSGHSALQVLEGVGPRGPAALTRAPFYRRPHRAFLRACPAGLALYTGIPVAVIPAARPPHCWRPGRPQAPSWGLAHRSAAAAGFKCVQIQQPTGLLFLGNCSRDKNICFTLRPDSLGLPQTPQEGPAWRRGLGAEALGCRRHPSAGLSSLLVTQSEGGPWLGRKTTLPTPSPRQGFAEWGEGHTSPCNHTGGKRQRRKTPRRSLCFSRRS